jgi:hypothetical protein
MNYSVRNVMSKIVPLLFSIITANRLDTPYLSLLSKMGLLLVEVSSGVSSPIQFSRIMACTKGKLHPYHPIRLLCMFGPSNEVLLFHVEDLCSFIVDYIKRQSFYDCTQSS